MPARHGPPPKAVALLKRVRKCVAGIRDWTLEDWHVALTVLRRLSVKKGLGLHSDKVGIIDLESGSVGQIGYDTVRVVEAHQPLNIGDEYSGPYVVYPEDPGAYIPLHAAGHLIPAHSLPVMIINLAASDTHIIEEVERTLRKRKGPRGLPRTTGPYSLSRSLSSRCNFDKWKRFHIIELTALLAWRGKDPARMRRYPDRLLGNWIDEAEMTPQKTSEAITVIKQAINALPYVLAEVQKIELRRRSE